MTSKDYAQRRLTPEERKLVKQALNITAKPHEFRFQNVEIDLLDVELQGYGKLPWTKTQLVIVRGLVIAVEFEFAGGFLQQDVLFQLKRDAINERYAANNSGRSRGEKDAKFLKKALNQHIRRINEVFTHHLGCSLIDYDDEFYRLNR